MNEPPASRRARQAFKLLNRFMLGLWKLGLGRWVNAWPGGIGQIMVIGHTGRRTRRRRATPVNFAFVEGELYCIAGFGPRSDWFRNLKVDPRVEVWLPRVRWLGLAEELPIDASRLPIVRAVTVASGFAAPLFAGIRPRSISDEDLQAAMSGCCLVHIRRREPGEIA